MKDIQWNGKLITWLKTVFLFCSEDTGEAIWESCKQGAKAQLAMAWCNELLVANIWKKSWNISRGSERPGICVRTLDNAGSQKQLYCYSEQGTVFIVCLTGWRVCCFFSTGNMISLPCSLCSFFFLLFSFSLCKEEEESISV